MMISSKTVARWLTRYAQLVADNEAHLTELDSPIGDADHGANMKRGMQAALPALESETMGGQLKGVAMAMLSKVGGTSGPLYGTFFLKAATALGDATEVEPQRFASALRSGLDGLIARGKTELDDKTMVDALAPALDALEAETDWSAATRAAAKAAAAGRDHTIGLLARKGRASYLGERSVGHMDPGAASATLLFDALIEEE